MALNTEKLVKEQARQIFQTAAISALTHIAVVAFLYSFLSTHVDNELLVIWSLSISAVALSRLSLAHLYKRQSPENPKKWLNIFTGLTLLIGLLWGCFSLLSFTSDDPQLIVVFVSLTCGVMALAAPVLAAWTPAYYANTVPQFFALNFVFLNSHNHVFYLAAIFFMFYAMLNSVQEHVNKNIKRSVKLRHKNDNLVEELSDEIDQREQIIRERTLAIKTSERRFQSLLEEVEAISVQGYNEQRQLVFWNDASEKIYGYSRQEALGKKLEDLIIPAEMKDSVVAAHDEWINQGIPVPSGELTLVDKDGVNVEVLSSHVLLTNRMGEKEMFCIDIDLSSQKKAESLLRESEERLRLSQVSGGIGTWEYNYLTQKSIFSDVVLQELGFPLKAENSTWDDVLDAIYPEDKAHVNEIIEQHIVDGSPLDLEYRITDTQGEMRWMRTIGKAEFDADGHAIKLRGTVQEVTDKKLAEEKLQLLARVFSDTHEGITITDCHKNIVDVNPAFCNITGYSREDVIGKNPRILSSGKQSPQFYQEMWRQVDEQGHWQGEVWNRKKSGEMYAELLTVSILSDDNDNIVNYVGVFSDITSSKEQQEKLHLMAHYDVLTNLPNRALFVDRFNQAIAHSKRKKTNLAVCFLDLDHFKPVNDNYGHEVGDQLLIEVADRITHCIREEDTVSRQGGDEFAILLNDIASFTQCEQTLERIHISLAQPYIIDEYPHKISASSGITLYPDDKGDIDTLLRHADNAMYQAKQLGRDRYHLFNTEQDQEVVQKHHHLAEIEQALVNNDLTLYYQPKVNMVSGEVTGVEALIRWIHPEKGLIPPIDFLPLIDSTDLEIRIGDWVINQALTQLDNWQHQGIKFEVSVNIASHHLQSERFIEKLDEALAEHPTVDSRHLQLEILESSALGDLQTVSNIINACQNALGLSIALDDFGTGYSSLTHLRRLSADMIKIDQIFVRDMLDDPSDYTIIDGIIALCGSFNRDVIAEGVETTNHGLMLLVMGCEKAQGYGIAKPLPAEMIPQWLANYTPNQEWMLCGNKLRSIKDNKEKLFRLITDHWKQRFVNNVQSLPEELMDWPIMDKKHCPCGSWIKRVKKEHIFEKKGLELLEEAHNEVHFTAYAIFTKYQDGYVDEARAMLPELHIAFDKMEYTLDQCR